MKYAPTELIRNKRKQKMLTNDFYAKYNAAAEAEMERSDRFSKKVMLAKAKEARLEGEMLSDFSAFLQYAEETPSVKAYLYLRYYVAYQSGEKFTGATYEKLPTLSIAEEKFPGFCEVAIGIAAVDVFREYLRDKKIAEYIDDQSYYNKIVSFMKQNKIAHNTYGLKEYGGTRHNYAIGLILRIGRLVYEKKSFYDIIEVYKKGNTFIRVALPGYKYTEEGYIGENGAGEAPLYEVKDNVLYCRIYGDDGRLCPDVFRLPLSEYDLFLKHGDPVFGIHIPAEGKLSEDAVDESLALAKKISAIEEALPRKFMCTSWLLDPQLRLILPPESNIIKFQKRFRPISTWINGFSLYKHIFEVAPCPIEALVPKNSFQKAILDSLKSGRPMRHGHGFLDIKGEK